MTQPNNHSLLSSKSFRTSITGGFGRIYGCGFSAGCMAVLVLSTSALQASRADSGASSSGSSSGSQSPSADGSNGTQSGSRVLSGSANDKAAINPSVRLVPPTPEKHILNSGANVKQFNGQAQSTPGSPVYPARIPASAYFPQRQTPSYHIFTPILPARIVIERPHVPYTPPAPPKWNYTLTPRNGIMTWSPGYQISHVTHSVAVNATANVAANVASTNASLSQKGLETRMSTERLSPGTASWTGTGIRKLPTQAPPTVAALSATPQLLSEVISAKEKKNISWEDWYKRICKTIYEQWILNAACPGEASVRVTVWSSRDIEAKILSFTPADGLARNAIKETAFREISLRAINSLQKTETLDFPLSPSRTMVIFDLDMNRSVNGPSGCVVAAFHDTGALPASTAANRKPGRAIAEGNKRGN
jgi:hypothetical protein